MAISKKPKFPRICPQGKTYRDIMRFYDEYRNPVSFADYVARIEVRSALPDGDSVAGDDDVLITLTTDDGITIEEHEVSIIIPASVTETFPVGVYYWELELVGPNGEIPYIMEPSTFKVRQEVTLNG